MTETPAPEAPACAPEPAPVADFHEPAPVLSFPEYSEPAAPSAALYVVVSMVALFLTVVIFIVVAVAKGQRATQSTARPQAVRHAPAVAADASEDMPAAAYLFGLGWISWAVCVCFAPLIVLAANVIMILWVAKDASARGMDTATPWIIVVFFTGVLGLVLYLAMRPKAPPTYP